MSLSGCRYSSFDEYLEALGIKDPPYEEVEDVAAYEDTLVLSEDSATSLNEPSPVYQPAEEDYSYSASAARVMTDAELAVGSRFDFRG